MSMTMITPVEIPYPPVAMPHLRITAAASVLHIHAGSAEPWVQASYQDPSGRIPLDISQDADGAHITVPKELADLFRHFDGLPRLDLVLGTARPFTLSIETGASEDQFELGGLPLTRLVLNHGAGKVMLCFSSPNPTRMSMLKLSVGAAALEARGLANASASEMVVEGGAAGVQLDFDGMLSCDCRVRIATALAGVELSIPAVVAAEITSSSFLGGAEADAGFTRRGDAHCTRAAMDGKTPLLTIRNESALGGLRLRTPSSPVLAG